MYYITIMQESVDKDELEWRIINSGKARNGKDAERYL